MKNTVKITSGNYRGREILTPGGLTHPMGERERIALFNMISPYLPGAEVLDAYAGSGALGIEALSRGASSCVFIEHNAESTKTIKQNLEKLGISENAVVYRQRVADFEKPERLFDLIIADPPYDNFKLADVEHLARFLKDDGIFVLSHPIDLVEIEGLTPLKTRRYARAHISIFKK